MATQVILLERIEKLGQMGDVVGVKPGYARNYLLPQHKALRATKDNIAYFETQKSALEKQNNEKKKEAEKTAKKLDGLKVAIIRQASEGGQLYGSVTARDIAEAIAENASEKIERYMVTLNQNYKMIGLFPVEVALHPEVKIEVMINIARSADEAKLQEKSGKALIAGEAEDKPAKPAAAKEDAAKEEFLEDSAIEAEKEKEQAEAEKAEKDAAKAEAKAAKEAEKTAEAEEDPAPEAEAKPAEEASEEKADK